MKDMVMETQAPSKASPAEPLAPADATGPLFGLDMDDEQVSGPDKGRCDSAPVERKFGFGPQSDVIGGWGAGKWVSGVPSISGGEAK